MSSHIPQCRSSEWRNMKLGEVCTKIGSGATPRGGKKTYLQEGPFALIRSQNVYNDGFHHDGLAFISDEQADDLRNVKLAEEDVLLNITGDSVARVCQVDPGILPARVNQHVAIVRPDPAKLDAGFLRYYLVSPHVQSMLLSWADSGSTRKALTKQMIESFEVSAPADVDEQRAIAHILGTLDDKIELNRRMNETLEEMARALFKSWFVDFDPVRAKMDGRWCRGQSLPGMPADLYDLFPDRLVDSELGEIPAGWDVSEIGREVEVVGGSTPSTKEPTFWQDGDIHWATPKDLSNLQSLVLLGTERKITSAGLKKISSGLLPVGTVLMSSRAPVGYLAIAQVPLAVNQGFIAMKCNKRISNTYIFFWCEENMEIIKANAGGTTFAEISKRNFRPLKIIVPVTGTMPLFDSIFDPIMKRITVNDLESRFLAALRDTLLPKLVSGEVGDAERSVENRAS